MKTSMDEYKGQDKGTEGKKINELKDKQWKLCKLKNRKRTDILKMSRALGTCRTPRKENLINVLHQNENHVLSKRSPQNKKDKLQMEGNIYKPHSQRDSI